MLADYYGRFIGVRVRRIRKFRWIRHITGNDGQYRLANRFHRKPEFGARNPVRIVEAIEDRMLLFNARIERIAVSADYFAGFVDSENISKTEIGTPLVTLGIHARFKRCEQGATRFNIGP